MLEIDIHQMDWRCNFIQMVSGQVGPDVGIGVYRELMEETREPYATKVGLLESGRIVLVSTRFVSVKGLGDHSMPLGVLWIYGFSGDLGSHEFKAMRTYACTLTRKGRHLHLHETLVSELYGISRP